ncbi:glutamate ligase [Pseudomonas sp. CCM 7893]|uniref:Glutamate ligase n=1 Tax=Pseudomonas spelaei TaxID=1055469 RepID=A0A6I3WFJ5_9PSED|nr:UDP-N-acetylmuramoyl-tripeptide--D-alanyl-D-alanine ligase [Pseudomonas spelaei]MUF05892.1 glutamate ligase [Pseudomonas spelaei]
MSVKQQLLACYALLSKDTDEQAVSSNRASSCTLFFSISDSTKRAHVFHVSAENFEKAWQTGANELQRTHDQRLAQPDNKAERTWIRVERAINVKPTTWEQFNERLKRHKRNYFRGGIAFDRRLHIALTEQELNANAILYGGNNIAHASFNAGNFSVYAKRRFAGSAALNAVSTLQPDTPVYLFDTAGVFCAEDGMAHRLNSNAAEIGWRTLAALTPDDVRLPICTAATYLGAQVQDSGQFVYGYFPCFDRPIKNYNTLRHASSTYAMIEAWALSGDETLKAAIQRSLDYLTQTLIRPSLLPDGSVAAFLVDTGNEIKLGGNAVCLLALVKYSEVTGTRQYLPLLEALANGMAWMQDPTTGAFVHVLHAQDLSVKEPFRIIYYDGEAAFGLMRLYGLTRNERWLNVVEKAFDYFIDKEHWREHDHWLSYCVNELTRYRPAEKYFRFGLNNVAGYLGFVQQRITTFPTLLELMMAAQQMLERIAQQPPVQHLLQDIDLHAFYRALHHRARYLLNGYFWPEMAMYFANPARIAGAFFIRHHAFRVRIDDVEHYLSGLIAYHRYLLDGAPQVSLPPPTQATCDWTWDAATLARVTQGTWAQQPPSDWRAAGLTPSMQFFKPGRMLSRHPTKVGPNEVQSALRWAQAKPERRPCAFLCVDPTPYLDSGLPALQVADTSEAMLQLGRHARLHFSGQVFGVTGSFGKTTVVAMLAHALKHWAEVGQTEANANLPHGIAWNLASMPPEAKFWVLEMAVGRMPINSELVRPHIAIVTGLAPAHLEYHGTLENLARKKSAIFRSMAPGGHAVLSRDMPYYELFAQAAETARLKVISYGEHTDADLRLLDWRSESDQVYVRAQRASQALNFTLQARGRHMVLNALAVLASLFAAGLEANQALKVLTGFEPVEGRGNVMQIQCAGGHFQLINDAYNANPGSMAAALQSMADLPVTSRHRVLVLGDMLELGPDTQRYHLELATPLRMAAPRHVLLCGPLMHALYLELRGELSVQWFENAKALNQALMQNPTQWFHPGDWVLVKSSGGTGLSQLCEWLKTTEQAVLAG